MHCKYLIMRREYIKPGIISCDYLCEQGFNISVGIGDWNNGGYYGGDAE